VPKQSTVTLDVQDVHGRLVKSLVSGEHEFRGRYSVRWDGTNGTGQRVASGMYFARMQAGSFSSTKKVIFQK
jgi:flagellar hook assembly protein FlgD